MTFDVGDEVEKIGGDYTFIGVVVAAFLKRGGAPRYVVEDDRGLLFIFNGLSLRVRSREEQAMTTPDTRTTAQHVADFKRAATTEHARAVSAYIEALEAEYALQRFEHVEAVKERDAAVAAEAAMREALKRDLHDLQEDGRHEVDSGGIPYPTTEPMAELSFRKLREVSQARQREWYGDKMGSITLSYRGNELAGEVGEACNIIKKIEREQMGVGGSRATPEQLAEELGDVVLCVELIAAQLGIDLAAAVISKFNKTSAAYGLKTRLEP